MEMTRALVSREGHHSVRDNPRFQEMLAYEAPQKVVSLIGTPQLVLMIDPMECPGQ